jgi:hypothetical protein
MGNAPWPRNFLTWSAWEYEKQVSKRAAEGNSSTNKRDSMNVKKGYLHFPMRVNSVAANESGFMTCAICMEGKVVQPVPTHGDSLCSLMLFWQALPLTEISEITDYGARVRCTFVGVLNYLRLIHGTDHATRMLHRFNCRDRIPQSICSINGLTRRRLQRLSDSPNDQVRGRRIR